jgi:hypothetical protein
MSGVSGRYQGGQEGSPETYATSRGAMAGAGSGPLVVDRLMRYPEVEVVTGTSGEANVAAFDRIFARHGNPEILVTDNGPPFNGGKDHILQKYIRQEGIRHKPTESADDPEANGLAEAFMKHAKKVWHTSIISNKDPTLQLHKHLKMYRAAPHPTTGKSPAELLFARKFRTKLPDIRTNPVMQDIQQARDQDRKEKARQKMYKDGKSTVRPHQIKEGDTILMEREYCADVMSHDNNLFQIKRCL